MQMQMTRVQRDGTLPVRAPVPTWTSLPQIVLCGPTGLMGFGGRPAADGRCEA
jgi:hypothetical protein